MKVQSTPHPLAGLPTAKAAVEAYESSGTQLPLQDAPRALDEFLSKGPAELQAVRDQLKASAEGQRVLAAHQQDDLWKGRPTADKLVKILAGDVPTTPEQAAGQLSDAISALMLEGPGNSERLAELEQRVAALREVQRELEGVKRLGPLEATGVQIGFGVSTGLPGLGGAAAEAGVALRPEDRQTERRKAYPLASVGVGTPVAGAGYVWSKEPGSTGKSLGVSVPFFGFSQDPVHGKRVSAFIPNVASLQMTERGEFGFSFALPILPFVQVGFSCFIENPVISRVTGPAVRGMEKVIGPATRAVQHAVEWVKENVLGRGGDTTPEAGPEAAAEAA